MECLLSVLPSCTILFLLAPATLCDGLSFFCFFLGNKMVGCPFRGAWKRFCMSEAAFDSIKDSGMALFSLLWSALWCVYVRHLECVSLGWGPGPRILFWQCPSRGCVLFFGAWGDARASWLGMPEFHGHEMHVFPSLVVAHSSLPGCDSTCNLTTMRRVFLVMVRACLH